MGFYGESMNHMFPWKSFLEKGDVSLIIMWIWNMYNFGGKSWPEGDPWLGKY